MKSTKNVDPWDLFRDYANTEKEREYWIGTSEFEQVKIARYMLERSVKKFPEWIHIEKWLKGWIEDCVNQASYEKEYLGIDCDETTFT